ncbi:MAG: hypothetical protein BWK79_08730 [Beggiatoa sp. IS2]|nr:MAG: hypothetical protein BWK79_08730 [Beggiatoa sp. IS2]
MAVYRSTILVLSLSISACVGREVIHHGCYVVDPFLRGTYTGECQEQMAHGRGVTIGKDSYQGDFVRGFLHGQGVLA